MHAAHSRASSPQNCAQTKRLCKFNKHLFVLALFMNLCWSANLQSSVCALAAVHELKETTFTAPPKDSAASDGLTSPLSRLQLGDLSHAPSSTLDDDEAALNNIASPRSVMSDEVIMP